MKFKINKRLLPVKAHFFFFFAALGPVLPQLNVFGKQLGVSPAVMGVVTAFLPLFWAAAKPLFGYVVDYWPSQRKLVFMMLITLMTGSYCSLWFLPMPEETQNLIGKDEYLESVYNLNDTVYVRTIDIDTRPYVEKYSCHWSCSKDITVVRNQLYLTNSSYINTMYIDGLVTNTSCSLLHMEFDDLREDEVVCRPVDNCDLLCFEGGVQLEDVVERGKRSVNSSIDNSNVVSTNMDVKKSGFEQKNALPKEPMVVTEDLIEPTTSSFYMTATFWVFVVLMCVGTVAFNVANCIGDAVCFDVLGSEGSKYGLQRAWGTAGYGLTALLGGWLVDLVSDTHKDFTPAFLVALVATVLDLYSCRALTLPPLSSPEDGGKALKQVLKIPRVLVFITFAVVAGTFDSFIIYYMFWYLEDIAEVTGHLGQIKLIEGVVVAAQSLVGELLFFYFSGKIIKRLGYGTTLTLSLFCYGVRMFLISLVRHPWHFVFIEGVMQGPTYALCYSTIVGYAAHVAPAGYSATVRGSSRAWMTDSGVMQGPTYALCYSTIVGYAAHVAPAGYSATVQGVVAGMDDGLGFALGSLVGGQLFARFGGQISFQIFAAVAVVAAALHAILFALVTRDKKKPSEKIEEQEETMLREDKVVNNAIYRDTVEPLLEDKDLSAVTVR